MVVDGEAHQGEVEEMLIIRHLKGEGERGWSEDLVSGGLKWFWDLTDIGEKSASSFRNEEFEVEASTMETCKGGLDWMALWQIWVAQAMNERMREQPQRVTNPGLASWLADEADETFCGK